MLSHQAISPGSSSSIALILPESLSGSPAIGGFPLQKEEEEALLIEEEFDDSDTDYYRESGVTQELRSAFSSVTLFLSENLMGSPAIGAQMSEEDGEFDDDDDASGSSQDKESDQEESQQSAEFYADSNSQDYEDDLVDAVIMASALGQTD